MGHTNKDLSKENAASSAKDNGVKLDAKRDISRANNSPKQGRSAMSKYAPNRHKRAARMLGYCLTLDTVDAWWGFADVMAKRLTVKERTALAFMALNSLDPEDAALAADAAMHAQSGEVAA